MLHTYKIDSRESGHDAESWSDAYALALSICTAAFDAGDGDFFVIADDDSDEEMRAVRDLISTDPQAQADLADPAEYEVDDLMIVTNDRGDMRLIAKVAQYSSDPRDPEMWKQLTLDEAREIEKELSEIEASSHDTEWSLASLEVDRAGIKVVLEALDRGEEAWFARDEDGHYFATRPREVHKHYV